MRIVVVGLGVQGYKRRAVAGADCVATVDPVNEEADYRSLFDVPVADFDSAMLCIPDQAKIELIEYLLANGKHVLVEKPLTIESVVALQRLEVLALENRVTCYTAYNHRFEPHFMNMKELLAEGALGKIYSVRLFYGNGTARLVRDSIWRDQGDGVLSDLGSHILDALDFWFGADDLSFDLVTMNRFENKAPDHCIFGCRGRVDIQAEMTLLSWRNSFYADVLAEKGSAHIRSLCKWGPSEFIVRKRELPSGRPDETVTVLTQSDPTWVEEYQYFKALCAKAETSLQKDFWIESVLEKLRAQWGALT